LAQGAAVDASAVARLRAVGTIVVGKTATSEHGWSASTVSRLGPATRNPWCHDRSAGGSSGGAAAAVAADLSDVALGTDGAGSIRIPAAFCGVVSFKPSFGRIPYAHVGGDRLAHVGSLAATVREVAETTAAIAGPHWDLIENALRELAGRRGGWLGGPLTAITMLASLIDQADRMIPELAADARKNRASWADIAIALGTSPEQAELRYSPRSPLPGPRHQGTLRPRLTPRPEQRKVANQPIEGSKFRSRQRVSFQMPLTPTRIRCDLRCRAQRGHRPRALLRVPGVRDGVPGRLHLRRRDVVADQHRDVVPRRAYEGREPMSPVSLSTQQRVTSRRDALAEARQNRRPSRLGSQAGSANGPDVVLDTNAGFPGLLKQTWHQATAARDPEAAFDTLLTLAGHIPADVGLRGLRLSEEVSAGILFERSWRADHWERINADNSSSTRWWRLF
jgi:hypothetical protein